jgi:hypothetical protein
MSKKAVDFGALFAEVAGGVKPGKDREAKIMARYNEYFQRLCQTPGANVSTETPQEVEQAVAEARRTQAKAARAVYELHRDELHGGLEALVADADAKTLAAVEAQDALRTYQRLMTKFASACGMPATPPIDDPDIAEFRHRGWRERAQRVLHPPKPVHHGVVEKLFELVGLD